ncbi:MAG: ribosomal RNA small subunit methyltransferase A [Planctomycetes bacterium]|nr:ribosomal RNA small subunit methyltransferase A [Planctomycetota bacterium]MBI3833651.1 ribosomal RNA small subunit methyltransferase A [Planctomycetota bacterium]
MTDSVEHVQTKREIEALLDTVGQRPRKRFGQHFLIDGNMMRRLVEVAEIGSTDVVLEVGAGTGGLTDLLVRHAGLVIAVEIDRDLFAMLCNRFPDDDRLLLIEGDVLTSKHEINRKVSSALRNAANENGRAVKLVANLPYNVATPLLMNLLADYPMVRRMCFTVQAEVGERIASPPDCKAYGPLSILTQALCTIETVARLGPQCFWPRPAVDSVMMRMDVHESPFESAKELHSFMAFVRGVFEHRRKTLRSALGYVLEDVIRERICEEFDCNRRPEQLDGAEWRALYRRTLK